jgi:hypothetical protein
MNKTLNFKTFKTFLQLILLVVSVFGFSQTYPDLEMGNVTPNPNTSTNVTVALQKDTNNNTGSNLISYTTPSALNVNYNVNAVNFTNAVYFGDNGVTPFYTLMSAIGNAGSDNTQYTSFGVPTNGMGIDINTNYGLYIEANLATAGNQAGNGRVKLGEITINLSRGTNNPLLHFKGLGGFSTVSLSAEFTVKSVLNSANQELLSSTTISRLSGNINTNNVAKTLGNDYTGTNSTAAATTSSARGTVRFQNNDIKTIVLEVYGKRNGSSSTVAWSGVDAFMIGLSAGESDLRVTKTVNNSTPNEGSNIVFTVTASNLGASNNSNVTVNDLLPSGYTYVSHTASTGTYVPGTGVWTIGNLNDAANATLAITAKVNPTGNFTNSATISTTSGIFDPDTTNNSVSVSTTPVIVDSDGDGVPNAVDLDDDNDGILDTDENSCNTSSKVEGTPIFINDFGTGTTTTDPYVLSHAFDSTDPNDGFYAVTTSNNQTQYYTRTNSTGNKDAGNPTITDGTTTGRYLMINIDSPNNTNKAIYRVPGIYTVVGQSYRFRIDMAGLADGLTDVPNLKIAIKDASNNELASATSTTVGMANNDVWRRLNLEFTATTSSVILEIINLQATGSNGNDVGIDNIVLTPLFCDADNDGTPNQLDLDSDNDGCPDAIEGGDNVTAGMLNGIGRINVAANGTTTPVVVDANGVPVVTNTSSTYNVDGQAQGQTIGQSQINNPAAVGGTASSNQTICWNTTPSALTLTGSTGSIQWQSSTDNVTFNNISGATSATYAPGALTTTTYYRAILISAGGCTAKSTTVTIIVNNCIDAVNDTYASVTPGTTSTSVIINDKNNSGTAAVIGAAAGQVSIRTATDAAGTTGAWPTGFTLNADGTITVAAGTAAGTYTLYYTICNQTAGSPCDTTSVTITVQVDTDGDGITDNLDLDDDNDGILDTNEGLCNISSTSSIDGFDSPVVPTINGNNIQSTNPYNGWRTETGGVTDFNVIRVNGVGYASGPDNAQSGNQYIDIAGTSAYVYKNITLTSPAVFSGSAWFANRESSNGGYAPWSTKIEIRNETTGITVAQGNTINFTSSISDEIWYNSSINSVALPAGTYRIRMFVDNYGHLDSISYCFSTDTDGDGTPDHLDLDSDNDDCPDAIEGGDNVIASQLTSNRISGTVDANGVPNLVNAGGAADIGSDQGQGIGEAYNAAIQSGCFCYKPAQTTGTTLDTNHGITALGRAGADNSNWPMVRKGAWTVLEAKTKGFVVNRLTDAQVSAIPSADLREGMMVYNITQDCLQINIDGTATGWRCFNTQTCPDL